MINTYDFLSKLNFLFNHPETYTYEINLITGIITCYTTDKIVWGKLFLKGSNRKKDNYFASHGWFMHGVRMELYFRGYISKSERLEDTLKFMLGSMYKITEEDHFALNKYGIIFNEC